MSNDYLNIYAFNENEKNILNNNKYMVSGKVKLSLKDIKIYFYLKEQKCSIGVTDLVKKCLIKEGYNIEDPKLYKPRKKPNSDSFYEVGSFWGHDEYRVDSFSRSLSKLTKVGLVKKTCTKTSNYFETVVKE